LFAGFDWAQLSPMGLAEEEKSGAKQLRRAG